MEQIDLNPLKEYLALLIADIIDKRVKDKTAPFQAPTQEILRMVNDNVKTALNEMVKDGVLSFSRTINGANFEFTPPK